MKTDIALSRRRLLVGVPAAAAAMAPGTATALGRLPAGAAEPSEEDQIFAVIEAHNAAGEALDKSAYADPPITRDQEYELECDWYDAQDDLMETRPTTIAGLLAFIDCLKEKEREGTLTDREGVVLNAIDAAIRAVLSA